MPKACTLSSAVESAQKCLPTAASPKALTIHARAVLAFVSVSIVVKVLDATMNKVVAGFRPFNLSAISAPSTFDTKCARGRHGMEPKPMSSWRGQDRNHQCRYSPHQ